MSTTSTRLGFTRISGVLVAAVVLIQMQADLASAQQVTESRGNGRERADATSDRLQLDLSFRSWRRSLRSGTPERAHLRRLWHHARRSGFHNAVPYADAAAETFRTEAPSSLGPQRIRDQFETISALAPDAPTPALQKALYVSRRNSSELALLAESALGVLEGQWRWLPTRMALSHFLLLGLVGAVGIGLFAILLGQIFRHLGVAAHDIARHLPASVTRWQVLATIWTAAAALVAATESLLLGFLALALVSSLSQTRLERSVGITAGLFVAVVPFVDAKLAQFASFPGSDVERWYEAQYMRCDEACRTQLASEVDGESPLVAVYSLALAEVRSGTPELARRAASRLQNAGRDHPDPPGEFANLRGAALITSGELDAAVGFLKRATRQLPGSAAPWYNLMRVAERRGEEERASRLRRKAADRNVALVERMDAMESDGATGPLLVPPLRPSYFVDALARRSSASGTILEPTWRRIAGPLIPMEAAPPLYLVVALLFGAAGALRWTARASDPCPRCGMAREPGDPTMTGGHHDCLPCYRTFVGGAEMSYQERVRYESKLSRRASLGSLARRISSVVSPGSGHAAAGFPLSGLAISVPLWFGAYLILQPSWSWRPSYGTGPDGWFGLAAVGTVLVSLPILVALWRAWTGIEPVQPDISPSNSGEAS